ncbi:MAG: tetratricopeptide repeat protein [Azonexaceae bacterium]|nr:tetratricopeptide repeat protein [Azonexaceae bacterium]
MSLINDMLRNIEAKRPDDPARQNLQREIRSLPAAPHAGRRWLVPLVLCAVPVLGAVALHANGQLFPLLGLGAEPVAVLPATPVVVPTPPAPPPAVVVPVEEKPLPDGDLRLAPNLAVLPLPAAPVLAVPDPVVPAPSPKPEPASLPVPQAAPAPAVPAGPVKIEKSLVLATPRDRAEAEYRKAENAFAGGRSAEGIEGLRAALRQDPGYVQARQMLLRQLLDLRKIDEAMTILQDGLEVQPAQTGWAMSLARLQLEQHDVAAADRTLAKSQVYAEASADYAGFQGHLKSRLGANRAAVTHYQRAARLAPNEGRWWLGMGLAQEADGRAAEARESLRRAIATGTLSVELSAVAEQHLR